MLGVLRPDPSGLHPDDRAAYRRAYCGLCAGLGADYGLADRAAHTWDGVFLVLVGEGLADHAAPTGRTRCPLAPWSTRETVTGKGPRYAAAVQLLAVDQRLADHAAEGARWADRVRPWLGSRLDRARAVAGPVAAAIEALTPAQTTLEARWPSPADAAGPTRATMAQVFAAVDAAAAPLGDAVGRALYLLDALEDLEGDHRAGRFNPCLSPDGSLDPARTDAAIAGLRAATADLATTLAALPLRRHRRILHSILCVALPQRVERACGRAASAVAARRRAIERRAGLGRLARGMDRLTVAAVALWVMLRWTASAAASPRSLEPRANHFCHPDCVKPSTYCGHGYAHDGRFGLDDCAARWWSGLGRRWDRAGDGGSWLDVLWPADTADYACGSCTVTAGADQVRGCCCDLPGWCSDLLHVFGWMAGMAVVAWGVADDAVGARLWT